MIFNLKFNRALKSIGTTVKAPPHQTKRVRHKGTVASTSPLKVYLPDGVVQCPAHLIQAGSTAYAPTIGDVVCIDDQNGDLVILGKYVS